VTLPEDAQTLGIGFVSLAVGIDATTPAGKLQMHISRPSQSSSELGSAAQPNVDSSHTLPQLFPAQG
jgi:hypothetical protein